MCTTLERRVEIKELKAINAELLEACKDAAIRLEMGDDTKNPTYKHLAKAIAKAAYCFGAAGERRGEMNWKERAEALWGLLDGIDTCGDMFHPEITPYFKAVNKKAAERHKFLESNGYELFIPGEVEPSSESDRTRPMTHNAS